MRGRFRDERDGSALPWLLGIAANVLADTVRRDRVETRARERLGLPLDLAGDDGYAAVEEPLSPRLALERCLGSLPEHERRALELRVLDASVRAGGEAAGDPPGRGAPARLPRAPAPRALRPEGGLVNTALPSSLTDYREALEEAVRRDLGRARARRRRRLALRVALVAAVLATAALGALSSLSRDGAGASVVDRAAAAVAPSPGTILHVDMFGSQTNGDGSVVHWRDESWQQQNPPYDGRTIQTASDGSIVESATAGRRSELYDPARDTIYVSAPESTATPEELNSYAILPGPRPGTAVLQIPGRVAQAKGARVKRGVITTAQANGLRKGTAVIAWRFSKRNGVVSSSLTVIPASSVPKAPPSSRHDSADVDPTSSGFRGQILALLRSGEAYVAGHRTVDGQDTIELASADGHTTYFVDPGSYRPVELRTRGTDGGTALRFRTFETLEPDAGLLSLAAQHPGARIDRDPAHYRAADERLHPNG